MAVFQARDFSFAVYLVHYLLCCFWKLRSFLLLSNVLSCFLALCASFCCFRHILIATGYSATFLSFSKLFVAVYFGYLDSHTIFRLKQCKTAVTDQLFLVLDILADGGVVVILRSCTFFCTNFRS